MTHDDPDGPWLCASPEDDRRHGTKDMNRTGCGKVVGATLQGQPFDPDAKNTCPGCKRVYR